VHGNASTTNAIRSSLSVNIDNTAHVPINGFNDIMAHEFGHVRDWVYAGDRQVSFTGQEVEEGLADMFAYDYDRTDATLGEDALGGARVDWAEPDNITYSGQGQPDHMDGYDETPPGKFTGQSPDEHFNSTILSHGYHLFVQRVGHTVAVNVLLNVSSTLPPQPKFFHVKEGIFSRAGTLYPHDDPADSDTTPEVREAARQAFTEVGLPPLIVPPIPFPGTFLD
jgi:Zn-dependent metalloprotease